MDLQKAVLDICRKIEATNTLDVALPKVKSSILTVLGVEGFILYERQSGGEAILQKYATHTIFKSRRLPLSTSSIPGIVALSQKPLAIADVGDADGLTKIHAHLKFNTDQRDIKVTSMLAAPIKPGAVPLGVMVVFNKRRGAFTKNDLAIVQRIGKTIGGKVHTEMQATTAPFEHLIQMKSVTQAELKQYTLMANKSGSSIAQVLITEGKIPFEDVAISLERYYMVPFMEYDPSMSIPAELVSNVKESYMRSNTWVPISGDKDKAYILIDDPTDMQRIMEIEGLLGAKNYAFMVGLPEQILSFIDNAERVRKDDLKDKEDPEIQEAPLVGAGMAKKGKVTADEDDISEDVIKLVDSILATAYNAGASDIHIQTRRGDSPTIVRFRIDGACRDNMKIVAKQAQAVAARIKIMSRLDISERRKPQDGKFFTDIEGKRVEFRVATVPTVFGENVVMRILASSEPMPLENLNLSGRNLKETIKLADRPHGIFLVVGPTGSGKTTTLHAVLGHINTPERVIWTAEDPVEITQQGLNQVQMHSKIGLNFASALRSFLRADPDVIMIGEMRDEETATIGVEASLTGHLVLSTLHTNSAAETVTRLLELGLDPINFSDALLGVLAQRLMRTLCKKCKKPYDATGDELAMLKMYYGEEHFDEIGLKGGSFKLFIPNGCEACGGTGYKGRTGIHELLVSTPEIATLIHQKATAAQIQAMGIKQGMRTLMQDGILKIIKGHSDISQLRKVAVG